MTRSLGSPTNLQSSLSGYTSSSTAAVPIANLLTWTGLPNATEYIIDRATSPGGTYQQVGTSATPGFFDSGLAPRHVLLHRRGHECRRHWITHRRICRHDPRASRRPDGHASHGRFDECNLAAMDRQFGASATGYLVLRSVNGGAYTQVASLPAASNPPPSPYNWTDTNLSPGTLYSYQVYAFNVAGLGNIGSVTGLRVPTAPYLAYVQINGAAATLNYTALLEILWVSPI